MTQSDDTLGRDSSCESKCLDDKLQQSVTIKAAENETNRGEESDRSSENGASRPVGSLEQINSEEMGSTDSAANTHNGGSSCGLVSSLFPNSCRGRAESFARRLHRRLTSLGGEVVNTSEDEEDGSVSFGGRAGSKKVNETSWLHGGTKRAATSVPTNSSATSLPSSCPFPMEERVLDSQPRRSPESDVYYDFEVDPCENERREGKEEEEPTGSPVEMANDDDFASIHVNSQITRINHREPRQVTQEAPRPPESSYLQDSESGCTFESPLAGTSPEADNSELYFDPETSETERTCESRDKQGTCESQANETIAKSVILKDEAPFEIHKRSLRRRMRRNLTADKHQEDDTSESSSSSCNPDAEESVNYQALETRGCKASSEESLNDNKSSPETTSPSHESLWSTFDDSTLSFQDESNNCLSGQISASEQTTALPKSHSDSEIVDNPSRSTGNVDEVDHVSPVPLAPPLTNSRDDGDSAFIESDRSTYRSCIDIPGALALECPSGLRIAKLEENLRNQVDVRTEDTSSSEAGMSRLLERLACSPNIDQLGATKSPPGSLEDETGRAMNDATRTKDEATETDETKQYPNHPKNEEEEEGEEVDRPQRVRRCSSLKTGKTPPGTPCRKKIVRFADVLGLDLADVRTFLDEIPKIPNSAYSDLIYDESFQKDSSPVTFQGTGSTGLMIPLFSATMPRGPANGVKLDRILVPLFQQPGGSANFIDLVRERQVCLENVVVTDPVNICLEGTVRVRNLDFHKSVHARYSLDSWRSFSDLQAVYASNSCDGFSDKFVFKLYCHTLRIGHKLELAVRFQCKGVQYWDNNGGSNYCFQCLPVTSTNSGLIPITAPTVTTAELSVRNTRGSTHDWSPTFY